MYNKEWFNNQMLSQGEAYKKLEKEKQEKKEYRNEIIKASVAFVILGLLGGLFFYNLDRTIGPPIDRLLEQHEAKKSVTK
jgi:hypothetical protein